MPENETDARGWTYYAKVEPLADGRWEVAVWSGDPMWRRSSGAFPREVAQRLGLDLRQIRRAFRSERRARKFALRAIALCEKRHTAKFDREEFTVRVLPPEGTTT